MTVMVKSNGAGIARPVAKSRILRMFAVEIEDRALEARSSGGHRQIAVAGYARAVRRMRKVHDAAILHMARSAGRSEYLVLLVCGRLMAVEAGFVGGIVLEADHLYAIHHVAVA